jgi:D-glycero-D-manno-heptose 1,7-bisphosphate phosphatase
VEELHKMVLKELPLEKIYTCYHDDVTACDCRKPRPGLILEAAGEYDLDLEQAWLVGDRWKDIDAGNAVGCQTVFVDYGYDEYLRTLPDHVVTGIKELPGLILDPTTQ